MNYKETLNYLYEHAPMFQQVGGKAYKEGLSNTEALDRHLLHPHKSFRSIHVAGTNGKGSCSHTLAAILQAAGYKVGLYTSPHLLDFTERIRINGKPIPKSEVVSFVEDHRLFFEPLYPSFFELTTAMAFDYFARQKVDVAVIETGLGGRLDCTNIIQPDLCVITNIGLDHTQFLGDTVEKIASEKAGIIKKNTPVVVGETVPQTRPVFINKAEELGAKLILAQDELLIQEKEMASSDEATNRSDKMTNNSHETTRRIDETTSRSDDAPSRSDYSTEVVYQSEAYPHLKAALGGFCQERNANTILHAVSQLRALNYKISNSDVRQGFLQVCEMTGLMGRWQKLSNNPTVICDTGHNVNGMEYIVKQLKHSKYEQLHLVIGMVNDKDIHTILSLLPTEATYYFTKASIPRALPEDELKTQAQEFGLQGNSYPTVFEAVQAAKAKSLPKDFIFVGGSSFIVADLLANRDALNLY